jgi:multiple sugar transport system permease protein
MAIVFKGLSLKTIVLRSMVWVLVVFVGLTMLVPFLWMLVTSLKDDPQVFKWPPVWIPNPVKFKNYVDAWKIAPWARFFFNSLFVSIVVTVVSLFFNSLAGFGFAKYSFPGRNLLFVYLLGTLMIPIYATMVPIFIMLKYMGWLDSYQGLIVPFLATAFGVFLMRQFFETIPTDLIEAARMDGCPEFRIFWQIVLPISKAPLATLAIFTFQGTWNNFIWPLIVVKRNEMRTIPLAVAALAQGLYVMSWPQLMAGASFAITPVIIVFLLFQRYFISGIALTGLKE